MFQVRFAMLFLVPLLVACPGTLDIWGINVPIPDDDDDDDDDGSPSLDLSNYSGVEYINIRWDQEQLEDGHFDCAEEFEAFGANTTADDNNLCPDCDEVWTVTLTLDDPNRSCLSQGTSVEVPEVYSRRIGIDFANSIDFTFFRNRADPDFVLNAHGIGALDGVEFTWSGLDGYFEENPELGFTLFFSGEGSF